MTIFLFNIAMDLTALGVATVFPDDVYVNFGMKALPGYAGNYGATGDQNCADVTYIPRRYLRIDLGHRQQIYSIRLHMTEGAPDPKYRHLNEEYFAVLIGESTQLSSTFPSLVCSRYSPQSSVFVCESSAQYIWMVAKGFQNFSICEVEVYAGGTPVHY